jgi:hypothetical protein
MIAVKPLGFRYMEMPHRFDPWDISLFGRGACSDMPHSIECRNVPKCPTAYALELSSCRSLFQCTEAKRKRRTINIKPQELQEALQHARKQEKTEGFNE